jgi:hypothetical protein
MVDIRYLKATKHLFYLFLEYVVIDRAVFDSCEGGVDSFRLSDSSFAHRFLVGTERVKGTMELVLYVVPWGTVLSPIRRSCISQLLLIIPAHQEVIVPLGLS